MESPATEDIFKDIRSTIDSCLDAIASMKRVYALTILPVTPQKNHQSYDAPHGRCEHFKGYNSSTQEPYSYLFYNSNELNRVIVRYGLGVANSVIWADNVILITSNPQQYVKSGQEIPEEELFQKSTQFNDYQLCLHFIQKILSSNDDLDTSMKFNLSTPGCIFELQTRLNEMKECYDNWYYTWQAYTTYYEMKYYDDNNCN